MFKTSCKEYLLNLIETLRNRRGLVGSVLAKASKQNTKGIFSAISSQQISGKNSESK